MKERPHIVLRANLQLWLPVHSCEPPARSLILGDSGPVDIKRDFADHQQPLHLAR